MPINPKFNTFKKPGAIKVSVARKATHSLIQKMRSWTAGDAAMDVTDQVAIAASTASASCTIACAGGAVGAFAVAASGPIAAGVLGCIGLMLAAKSTYSNREVAHNCLQPYVWSYIDDETPKHFEGDMEKVGAAAMYLITNGAPQMKLMNSKFLEAEAVFNSWFKEYESTYKALNHLKDKSEVQMKLMEKILVSAYRSNEAREKSIRKAFSQNGEVYNFLRRLIHFGNYMQAASIAGMIMQKDTKPLPDLGKTISNVGETRRQLAIISARIVSDDKAFEKVMKIMEG